MKPGMKMLMLERTRTNDRIPRGEYGGSPERRMIGYDRDFEKETRRYRNDRGGYVGREGLEDNRMPYDGMDYETESRRRDGQGRYMMDESYYGDQPEARRRRDRRGRFMEGEGWEGNRGYPQSNYGSESRRRRDSRGRYMMGDRMDGDFDDDDDDMRSQTWYPPFGNIPQMNMPPMNMPPMNTMYPMGMHGGNGYGDIYAHGTIYAPNAMNNPTGGMMGGDMSAPVDEHTARMWVQKMDGGEHFKPEQIEPMRASMCPDCNRWEWYTAMNAMYSDHCETAKKLNMDKPEFYAMLAKDFLKDADAKPHKLRRYMEHIAK